MAKLTDRQLNEKLMESLNITSADAKNAFNELMKEKVAEIRKEIRQEVYEELSKQSKQDKEQIIESMNQLTNATIAEEKKKNDIHRKNLIKEKLALKEAKSNIEKQLADKTALIKEEYNKKLNESVESIRKEYAEKQDKFIKKASDFLNENVKREVLEMKNDKKQLSESLEKFSKFISEQVAEQVKATKKEMNSLDNLRVRLVKESSEKLANAKKKFFMEASEKMEKFTNNAVARELKEFRQDIAESRKNNFGKKLFEAFAREYAVKFFNEDKVVKSMLESVKANQNKLLHTTKVLEKQLSEAKEQNKNLNIVNNKLTREKIINESIAHLTKDKQEMIRNLIKEVPTNQLNESIKKFIPMILSNSSSNLINKNEKVLKEGRKATFLTGENKQKRNSFNEDFSDLSSDLNDLIEKAIENSKF